MLGLANVVNKSKIQIMKEKWEEFIQQSNLSNTYFDKYDCYRMPTNGIDAIDPYKRYRGFYIGFGSHHSNELKKRIHQHSSSFTINLQGVVVRKGRRLES